MHTRVFRSGTKFRNITSMAMFHQHQPVSLTGGERRSLIWFIAHLK